MKIPHLTCTKAALASLWIIAILTCALNAQAAVNILLDGGFESGAQEWSQYAYRSGPDADLQFSIDNTIARSGSRSARVHAGQPNDARWLQEVSVQPRTVYRISGWIKTENVANSVETVHAGANLSVDGAQARSEAILGTRDWTFVSFNYETGSSQSSILIAARIGFYFGTTAGTAWFDDLSVEAFLSEDPGPVVGGPNPAGLADASVPPLINYQGRLTDANGASLPPGTYALRFQLWDKPASASGTNTLLWGRDFSGISMVNGTFNVILGDHVHPSVAGATTTNLAVAFSGAPERYLGITILRDGQGIPANPVRELVPRQQILSSPYAFRAAQAQVALNLIQEMQDILAPPGAVMAWMGTNSAPPAGWEFCSGQEVSRTGKYARLFTSLGTSNGSGDGSTTFRLPDLRGMFLRGVDPIGIKDPDYQSRTNKSGLRGPNVGSIQMDEFGAHSHSTPTGTPFLTQLGPPNAGLNAPGGAGSISPTTDTKGGTETRPKNVYVQYLIKL